MGYIITDAKFDQEKMAQMHPGKLVFRGTAGEMDGATEILARDLDDEQLEAAIKECLLDPVRKYAAASKPTVLVTKEREPKFMWTPALALFVLSIVISVILSHLI